MRGLILISILLGEDSQLRRAAQGEATIWSLAAPAGAWAGLPTIQQRAIFSKNSVLRVLIKMITDEDRFSCELRFRPEVSI
jgi:hypothetical protein